MNVIPETCRTHQIWYLCFYWYGYEHHEEVIRMSSGHAYRIWLLIGSL